MKLQSKRTAEYRISNRRMSKGGIALLSLFNKIDRIHYFDIHYSIFDIRFFSVSFPIRLDARGQRWRSYETSKKSNLSRLKYMLGGSGLRPRLPLPGKSRLKTAPAIQNSRYKTTKFIFRLDRPFFGSAAGLKPNQVCIQHQESRIEYPVSSILQVSINTAPTRQPWETIRRSRRCG